MAVKFDGKKVYKALIDNGGTILSGECRIASTFWQRFKGLMFESNIGDSESLLIMPCNSVHTFFMKFPIDLVFIDRNGKAVDIKTKLEPGKAVAPVNGAFAVIEMKGGHLDSLGLKEPFIGKNISFVPISDN